MDKFQGNVSHKIGDLLPKIWEKIQKHCETQPIVVCEGWKVVVGDTIASATKPLHFVEGILTVQVNDSTLFSLLVCYEKKKLLHLMKKRFPQSGLIDLVFKRG